MNMGKSRAERTNPLSPRGYEEYERVLGKGLEKGYEKGMEVGYEKGMS